MINTIIIIVQNLIILLLCKTCIVLSFYFCYQPFGEQCKCEQNIQRWVKRPRKH